MEKVLIALGRGYYVEIVETVPDKKGNTLEGFLYYGNTLLNDLPFFGLFAAREKLVVEFVTVILPKYIREHKTDAVKGLLTPSEVKSFVREYISGTKINYGQTIDIIQVLASKGYHLPVVEDDAFDHDTYMAFQALSPIISLELVKQLKSFGFGADRDNGDKKNHEIKEVKGSGWMNIVYTRYPWTGGYKMIKSVKSFINSSGNNAISGQDLTIFKKNDLIGYDFMMDTFDKMGEFKLGAKQLSLDCGFDASALDFVGHIDANIFELVKFYSKKRPVGYGKYSN